MSKSNVYTRTGDKGETSLVSGTRISKANMRISLYGEVDELNSHIGFMRSLYPKEESFSKHNELFDSIQSSLFDLGSKLACESNLWEKYKLPDIKAEMILSMESVIDELDGLLPKLKNFILPGGTQAASYTHVVRTACRKVERKLIDFGDNTQSIPENSIIFLNRLSDFLFVYARYCNYVANQEERIWKPN
ncbi:MAG: ATP:cob(I)alamin adenosyltransferase [Halobacteriovoraceae bacterium]|nr:ATP:cob(I)alamin adenosyltransferase [Halobacteriovoraceae bacterium]|tara:strand:+ start:9283 stop:9855 length:573 start_codon:yes stop_codon:yes gene_type:complete